MRSSLLTMAGRFPYSAQHRLNSYALTATKVRHTLHNVVGSGLNPHCSLRRISITSVLTRALYLSGRTVVMRDDEMNCFVVRSLSRGRRQCLRQSTIGSKQTRTTQIRFSPRESERKAGLSSQDISHPTGPRTPMPE